MKKRGKEKEKQKQKKNLGQKIEVKKNLWKSFIPWILILVVMIFLYQTFNKTQPPVSLISYSQFREQVELNNVSKVVMMDLLVHGELKKEARLFDLRSQEEVVASRFTTRLPMEDVEIIRLLEKNNVYIYSEEPKGKLFTTVLSFAGPFVLFLLFWIFIIRQMQGQGNKAFSFGKSRAKLHTEKKIKVTFKDVAGVDEAKEELQEIIAFLKDPKKFQRLGGKIPKGILLIGPPGSGKTLLARAVSGEAKVPFFTISGSDFVELFVGVGASRVRDLFAQGKKNAPCIIFIDEIDAVGRYRGAGLGGGHDEREQTLNALLVEMDGFEPNEGVVLIAATNRPDVLDPALLRPGRFDRQIVVDNPDIKGREGILKVHTRKIKLAKDVDLSLIARSTPGFSGADLANLVNEAALLAARKKKKRVEKIDLEEAKDRVMMGPERRSLIISDEEKKNTAYHESGHALVSFFVPKADPIHKITIIPRGRALGVSHFVPVEDRHTYSKTYLISQLTVLLGGRAAEEVIFSEFSNGAGNDIRRATDIVRKMVCEWGMSEKLGPVTYGRKHEQIFLGRDLVEDKNFSEETAKQIDDEIRNILRQTYNRAKEIIIQNRATLEKLAKNLIEKEVLEAEEIEKICRGEKSGQKQN